MSTNDRWVEYAFLTALVLVTFSLAIAFLPPGIDWRDTYRPAALALLQGASPYTVDIFFAPPWSLIPLIPFALLPVEIGRAMLFVVGLCSYAFTAYKLGAKATGLAAFIASPIVLHGLLNSNVEWLVLLGFVLPPQLGLFFVTIKPQIGIGMLVYWGIQGIRDNGIGQTVRDFLPISLVSLASFAVFGLWPLRFRETLVLTRGYNASFWPFSIPIGLALLCLAFWRKDSRFAMAASPFISPYVLFHAWVGPLVSIVRSSIAVLLVVLALWVLVISILLSGPI